MAEGPIPDTGGTDQSAMGQVTAELKALYLDLAKQDLWSKKQTQPAKQAKQTANSGGG
jgi:isoleucyl-tRNA synthetase